MRILHTVEFYHPSKGGAQEVVRRLSELLTRRGHEVTVATTGLPDREERVKNGVRIEEFNIRGNAVRGMSGDTERYQTFLRDSKFDIIMNYAAQQWTTDLALPILNEIKAKKVLVPCGFSSLYDPRYAGYFNRMGEWMKHYDACVFLSRSYRDIDFARKHGIDDRIIIPNGASEEEFVSPPNSSFRAAYGIPEDDFLVLHVGSHTGVKGHAEAIQIFRRSGIENATFAIVGNCDMKGCVASCNKVAERFNKGLRSRKKQRLVVADLPRELTVAAYHEADVFLFPSNIECSPIVLFEAMASRTPFLTTDVGNAAEIISWGGGGMLLPTRRRSDGSVTAMIRESAVVLRRLHDDAVRRGELAERGYHAWIGSFTWERIAERYEELYSDLVAGRSATDATYPTSLTPTNNNRWDAML
jgi:glycosyltransferase involved in cell wall biosynthesis